MQVAIVGGVGHAYRNMFHQEGHTTVACNTDHIDQYDLLLFTGGEDVTPQLYGQEPHQTTQSNINRDLSELQDVERALATNTPMFGICRGAQFLNVAAGGRLAQHIEGHTHNHRVRDIQERVPEFICVSTHHQEILTGAGAQVLAIATDGVVEAYTYANGNVLGVQWHPENAYIDHQSWRIVFDHYLPMIMD